MPQDGGLEVMLAALGAHRGRPITLLRHDLPADGTSGLWVALAEKDYIVLAPNSSPTREAAVICHELGHMLLGHQGPQVPAGSIAPDIDPQVVARFMARHGYAADEEREAETVGTILASEHARRRARPEWSDDRVTARLR